MPKFFQTELAAYGGEKQGFQNIKFKKRDFNNSNAALAGTILEIIPVHIKNPPVIQFLAYVDDITDMHKSQQTANTGYGRSNPYYIWTSGDRNIRLGVTLVSPSITAGLDNLNNLSWLIAAQYPTYKDRNTATSIAASPLFRVRYGNLISSRSGGGQGVLCVIKGGVSVTHRGRDGYISAVPYGMAAGGGNTAGQLIKSAGFDNLIREGEKILIPKTIKLRLELAVVHDHQMGWDQDTGAWRSGWAAPGFPYGVGLVRDTKDAPSAALDGDINQDTGTPAQADGSEPAPGTPEALQEAEEKSWWDHTTDALQGKFEVGGVTLQMGPAPSDTWGSEVGGMGHTGM